MFADAVRAIVAKSDAPNFSMPQDAYFDSGDMLTPDRDGSLTAPAVSSDDREPGWSSALFPAQPPPADTASADMPNYDRSAEVLRSPDLLVRLGQRSIHQGDSLFRPRSSERRP